MGERKSGIRQFFSNSFKDIKTAYLAVYQYAVTGPFLNILQPQARVSHLARRFQQLKPAV
jgi:pyruvate carboxylase